MFTVPVWLHRAYRSYSTGPKHTLIWICYTAFQQNWNTTVNAFSQEISGKKRQVWLMTDSCMCWVSWSELRYKVRRLSDQAWLSKKTMIQKQGKKCTGAKSKKKMSACHAWYLWICWLSCPKVSCYVWRLSAKVWPSSMYSYRGENIGKPYGWAEAGLRSKPQRRLLDKKQKQMDLKYTIILNYCLIVLNYCLIIRS